MSDLYLQIDAAAVKTLDRNLFLGDEITEVYSEIMKTVPSDHLSLENVSTYRVVCATLNNKIN